MSKGYFPWRLYWKFFWALILLMNTVFILSAAVNQIEPQLRGFSFILLSFAGAAFYARRFAIPLRKIILRALRIASKKYATELEEDDVLDDQPGEYVELENALEKIRRKLKKRRLQLSHEREESQTLMGSMDDAIVSIGLDEKMIFFNSRFAAQFLTSHGSVPLTQCFREPEVLELFNKALRQGETAGKQIQLFTKLHAQQKFFSVRISPLREEKTRQIYGALAVFHDISEIKKAEKIRIEFVENASHELRTPLTAIKGFVETLRTDVQAGHLEQVPQFLTIVSKNVDRLTELVNDMLTISTLESSTGLHLESINPQILTEDVIDRLSKLAVAKKIIIKTQINADDFKADPGKLEQVLTNLIGNSIKYIPEGGIIEVRWDTTDEGEPRLSVKDNGPGIAPEHQSRLFERFYRIDKGRSRDVGGTGLGLSIVKHIMQSHGGSVQLVSQAPGGAEFICVFPRLS